MQGDVQLERAGISLPLTVGITVDVGDKMTTGAKAHATVLLRDGSKLMLGESCSIVVDGLVLAAGTPSHSSILLLGGHLRSVVTAALLSATPNFEIHTPNAIVGVRGTNFETAYIEGKPCPGFPSCLRYTDVGVSEGVVEVSNPTNPSAPSVRVAAGYETTVPCEQPPTPPGPLGMGELGAPGYR